MNTTISELREWTFGPGECLVAETHVSGKCLKGQEVLCTLPHIKYTLRVDLHGVAVARVIEAFKYGNATVKSQALLKAIGVNQGIEGVKKRLTGNGLFELKHHRPDERVKYDHYVGGQLNVTFDELFVEREPTVTKADLMRQIEELKAALAAAQAKHAYV